MSIQQPQLSIQARRQLSSARIRRIALRVCNLFLSVLAILLLLAGFAMFIDWFGSFRSTTLRILLSLSVCGGFLCLTGWVWRKLPFDGGLRSTAKWLDGVNPALEERLSTMVELGGKGSHSPELLGAVRNQVDQIGVHDDPRRAILAKPFLAAVTAIVCAFAFLGVIRSISDSGLGTLVDRLIHPWSDHTLTELPGKTAATYHVRGLPFQVSVPVTGKIPRKATLEYRSADGSVEQREITIDRKTGRIQASIPRVKSDFTYRVIAGDDETPWTEVTVIDRPELKDVRLVITPPAYTKIEESVWTALPRRIEVPEGSKVTLGFTPDQTLPGATVIQRGNEREQATELLPDANGRFQFNTRLTDSVQAEIQLTSMIGGLRSRFPITFAVKRDLKPQVKLLEGTETFAMKADETLDVEFRATDDYGIDSAEIVAQLTKPDGSKEKYRFPVELGAKAGESDLQAKASLDLKQIPLEKGDELSFAVEVKDQRGLGARDLAKSQPEKETLAQEIARLRETAQATKELQETLQAARDSNDKALAAGLAPPQDPANLGQPKMQGEDQQSSTTAQQKKEEQPDTSSAKQQAESQQTPEPAPEKKEGQQSPGDEKPSPQVAKQSEETKDLLSKASEIAASSTSGSKPKDGDASEHIEKAQEAVASAQAGKQTSQSLEKAKDEISRALERASEMAKQAEQQLKKAQEQAQAMAKEGSQGASQEALRESLQSAQAMANEAQQILQSEQKGQTGQSGEPGQQEQQNQQGQQGQQGQQHQQGQQPNPRMDKVLEQLEEKIKEAGKVARKLPADEVRDQIEEAIRKANDSAKQARNEGVTPEGLQKIEKELGEALKKLGGKNEVAKRKLDVAKEEKQPSKSGSAKVTVDEFAEYLIAGDGQKKQQIAIQEVLDLILASARSGRELIAQIGAAPDAGADQQSAGKFASLFAAKAPEINSTLNKGAEGAEELRKRSEGTPYSFFGLQAKAMVETGFAPAIKAVVAGVQTADTAEKATQLQVADERLRWVISQIEKNQKQFGKMIEYEEVLELAHKFRKMNEITIEDMPPSECDCRAGPYAKLKMELSDQDVQAEIAKLKLKREVLKRLSELLQKNPELRARQLAKGGESGKIYREELSRLRNLQQDLAESATLLQSAPANPAPALPQQFGDLLRQRLLKFSNHTAEVLGLARIWIPTETPDAQRKEIEQALAQLSQEIEGLAKADPLGKDAFGSAVTSVRNAGMKTAGLLTKPEWAEKFADYSEFRTEDLKGMANELDACDKLARSLREKTGNQFLAQLQGELNDETGGITLGMMDSLSQISGVSAKADQMIEDLNKLLGEKLIPAQKQAEDLISRGDRGQSIDSMGKAASALEEATHLLDSAITEFIRTKSEQDAMAEQSAEGEAKPLPDPSEEQIEAALAEALRKLEEESRMASSTKLGIGAEKNLKVKSDWEKDPKDKKESKSEKEELAKQIQKQMQSAKKASAAAGKAQQLANDRARKIAHEMGQKPAVPWKEQGIKEFEGRNDWNSIPSQLKESLTQDFDSTVPEEYRVAIEEYFRNIAEANKQ